MKRKLTTIKIPDSPAAWEMPVPVHAHMTRHRDYHTPLSHLMEGSESLSPLLQAF